MGKTFTLQGKQHQTSVFARCLIPRKTVVYCDAVWYTPQTTVPTVVWDQETQRFMFNSVLCYTQKQQQISLTKCCYKHFTTTVIFRICVVIRTIHNSLWIYLLVNKSIRQDCLSYIGSCFTTLYNGLRVVVTCVRLLITIVYLMKQLCESSSTTVFVPNAWIMLI